MRILKLLPFLIFAATVSGAQSTMTAAEFDAYTRGHTFYYGRICQPYGGEEYLDGRRVRWSFLDGRCQEGSWYEEAGMICFIYETHPDPQCWSFIRQGGGLVARFENNPDNVDIYEVEKSPEPLMCLGPEVGA